MGDDQPVKGSFWNHPVLSSAARLAWMAICGTALALFVLLTPRDFRVVMFSYDVEQAVGFLESAAALRYFSTYLLVLRLAALLVYLAVSLLIFITRVWRRSQIDWAAWLAALALFLAPLVLGLGGYQQGGYTVSTYRVLQSVRDVMGGLAVVSVLLFINLFPDGRFAPRWVGWLALGILVALFILGLNGRGGEDWYWPIAMAGFLLILGSSIYGQVYRYRNLSSPIQQQQIRWVTLGLAAQSFMLVSFPLAIVPIPEALSAVVRLHIPILLPLLVPLTLAASILRYHLWDIDLIIRRTLLYGALSAALGLIYYSGVTVLQSLLARLSGQSSTAAVVLSTLAIAALFSPLRNRFQEAIDRRFFRQKYDAEQALAGFATAARNETDIQQLSTRLTATVQETLQPEQVRLWLKK